jgi:SAM-dependent methyltransferase
MPSPWLEVPLDDYEGHMQAPQVAQLAALADLFEEALAAAQPESVAIIGIAGGNGLDRVDPARTTRIVGLDICEPYLDAVRTRHGGLPGLELHCVDLTESEVRLEPVDLVHAALVLEHAGVGRCLDNALSLVKPGGTFVAVLQLPSESAAGVAPTGFTSLQKLAPDFQLIDPAWLLSAITRRGFTLQSETRRPVASGKALWMGTFGRLALP